MSAYPPPPNNYNQDPRNQNYMYPSGNNNPQYGTPPAPTYTANYSAPRAAVYQIPNPDQNQNYNAPPAGPSDNTHESRSWLNCIPGLKGDNDRQGFVRKVYALLFIQLGITTIFVLAAVLSESFRDFMYRNMWLYLLSIAVVIAISFSLFCFYKSFQKVPNNYILLFIFTLAESYTVALITSFYTPMSVLSAALITLGMSLGLSLYACFTKTDYTKWYYGLLWATLGALIVFIILIIIYPSEYVFLIISVVVIILVSIFILVDTQLIMGGGRYELSMDDYVIAVLLLYTDIVTLFLYVLSLFGSRRD